MELQIGRLADKLQTQMLIERTLNHSNVAFWSIDSNGSILEFTPNKPAEMRDCLSAHIDEILQGPDSARVLDPNGNLIIYTKLRTPLLDRIDRITGFVFPV